MCQNLSFLKDENLKVGDNRIVAQKEAIIKLAAHYIMKEKNKKLNESQAIVWKASTFINKMLSLYPSNSFVQNIGFDPTGTHYTKYDKLHGHNVLSEKKITLKKHHT